MATYDLAYPGAAIDAILNTAYYLQEAGFIFRGSASDYAGTPSKREWVIAPAGFTGLGLSSAVPQGSIGVCLYNGTAWVGKIINVATIDSTPTQNSGNAVSSGGAYAAINQLSANVTEALENLTFTDTTPSAFQDEYINFKVSTTEGGVERILTYLTILAATTSKAGLLTAEDKQKIDSFLTNLRSLTFADTTAPADQGTQITETLKATIGGVQEVIDSITILAATSSKAGLLSASDKAYIDALPSALTNLSNSISAALALMESLVGYYVCDTAAGTAAKTVAATGYTLTNGGCIRIKMTNANTAANVTLNINSTGAKALYYDGTQASSTNTWEAGEVLEVYYDGTQYQCASGGGGGNEDAGYLNITNTSYSTFMEAANSLPLSDRKRGMYLAANVNGVVEKKQFVGSDINLWSNDALWIGERDELVSIVEGNFRSNYIEGKKLSNGNLANDTYGRVSNPIQVKKGDNITLYTGVNDANAWSVLEYHTSSEITNATLISRILAPNTNLNTYQSTVPQDCYVCFGCGNYRASLRDAYDVSYYVIVEKKSGLLYGTDIEDNLTSESSDKVLSAKQGNILNTGLQQQKTAYNQVDGEEVRDVTDLFHFVDNSIIRINNGSANGEEPGKLQYRSTWTLNANDNYIDVSAFQTMVVTFYSSNSEGLCFYDENYTLVDVVKNVDYLNQQHEMTLELLPTYKYVRLTISDLTTFSCVLKRQNFNGLVRDNEDDISILDITSSLLKGEKIYIDNGSAFQKIDGQFGFTRNRITFTVSTSTFVLIKIPCGLHNKMKVSASANGSTMFFLKEFYYYDNKTAYAVCSDEYESSKLDLTASETRSMYIPSDCCYLAIVYNIGRGATKDVFPSMITLENDGFFTEMNNMASSMRFYSATETNILEQMAHKNTTFFWKGSFYSLYMCDDTQGEEYVPNHKTIKVRLGIRSIIGLESTISRDIYWAKQRCGDVIVSDYAPSNCGMAISPNGKYLYMYANVRPMNGELETAVMTKFSLTSKIVESGCDILTLDGDTFTLTKVIQYYNSKCGTSLPTTQSRTTVWGLNLSSQIIKASDGMYYWGIGCAVNSFGGIIVKSSDLINWQGVTAYNLSSLSTTTVWEVALAETSTGVFSVAMRSNQIYTAAYNFTSDTWTVAAAAVPNTLATRPFFFKFGANHYMVCNVTGASSYATRATVAFYEVVSDGVVSQVQTKMVVEGCHYAEVVNVDGKLYMFYSSDPKHIMSAQAASKIMCEVITLN